MVSLLAILTLVFFYHCTFDREGVDLEDNNVSCLKAELHNPARRNKIVLSPTELT